MFHLSRNMVGQHCQEIIKQIRDRNESNLPCTVISTQMIEAGVDLDFPIGYRELAPYTSIIQMAGRINRHNKMLNPGIVNVFTIENVEIPFFYKNGVAITKYILEKNDLNNTNISADYFSFLHNNSNLDIGSIQKMRSLFNYDQVNKKFKMINQNTFTVVVDYNQEAKDLINKIKKNKELDYNVIREIQKYTINIFENKKQDLECSNLISQLHNSSNNLFIWQGEYSSKFGAIFENVNNLYII